MMVKALLNIYKTLFRNVTSQLAATAFTLSALSIVVLWGLVASSPSFENGKLSFQFAHLGPISAAILAALFLIMFFVVWFILYIQYTKEAEDIYSHLRVKLAGSWTASYDYTIAGKYVFPARPKARFRFIINQNKKLEMEFEPADNMLFSDVDQNVSQISLRHIDANRYSLIYFFSNKRTLHESIVQSIEADFPNQEINKIDVEVFGMLTFEDPLGDQKINELVGSWYDLNGQIRTLGVLMRERGRAEANNVLKDYRTKLSALVVEHSVSAKMGEVIFERN